MKGVNWDTQHHHKRRLRKHGCTCNLEGHISCHNIQGRPTRLRQLPCHLASLHTRESVRQHTAQELTRAEDFLQEAQWWFRANWGEINMIFSWQIHEKCIEKNMLFYMIFTKAFDCGQKTVSLSCPICQARICLAYKNEGNNQLKRRTLEII